MKNKILFIYRYGDLDSRINPDGSIKPPGEFFWGMKDLDRDKFEISFINAPRLQKRVGIRRLTWFIEFPFAKLTRIGLPIEIYHLFKKEIKEADQIVCVNDQISLGVLSARLFGKMKDKKIHCIVMSLQERIKYFRFIRPLVWFVSLLLRQADTILCLTDFVKSDFKKDYNLKNTKLETYHFGIDSDFWKPDENIKTENFILSIGNDMNRDYQTLVKALPEHIKLKIITRKKIDTKGKNIELLSGISDQELRNVYNQALFVIVPSIKLKNESSGLSCALQTMACKKALIISDAEALKEQFQDQKDCLFYQAQDPQDLAKKISFLLENTSKRQEFAENGHKLATQKYTCKNMSKRLNYILSNY